MGIDGKDALLYVALGDSLTLGIGTLFRPGFVQRYQQLAEACLGRKVEVHVTAKNGATSDDMRQLLSSKEVRQRLRQAQLITLSIGGNDLRRAAKTFLSSGNEADLHRARKQFRNNLHCLMKEICRLKKNQSGRYLIRLLEVYNPYPYWKLAEVWIGRFNTELKRLEKWPAVKVVPLHKAFKGKERQLLWIDGLHPNAKGYRLMADELDKTGYEPLLTMRERL